MSGKGGLVGGLIVAAAALFFWCVQLVTLTDLNGGDAAGNGMTQAFAALEMIVLWVLLAGLVVIAGVKGALPPPVVLPGVVAIPLSGVAALRALDLLAHPNIAPFQWPIVVSAVVPPLVVVFCLWALLAPVRSAIPAWLAAGFVWGATMIVSASIWPMGELRVAVLEQQEAVRAAWDAALSARPRPGGDAGVVWRRAGGGTSGTWANFSANRG